MASAPPPPPPPAAPARVWRAACPNCGAPVDFRSPASAFAVCGYCRSQVVREGDALRRTGEAADLLDDHSALRLGAAGTWQGLAFTLVGRRQLRSAEGVWSEWHALFDGGPDGGSPRSGWLSEDNGTYVFGFDVPLRQAAPAATDLRAGEGVVVDGLLWSVASVVVARVAATEGELPAAPRTAGGFVVADLRNTAGEVGTLEYERPDAVPTWSVGRPVAIADLAMSGLAAGPSEGGWRGRSLACPSCGTALALTLASTRTVVCGQCAAVVDVSGEAGADARGAVRAEGDAADVASGLAHYAQATGRIEPLIPLGTTGRLVVPDHRRSRAATDLQPWTVVGYQERCTLVEHGSDDEQSFWREYLLYHRTEGFAFLVDTDEGWSVVRPLTGVPQVAGRNLKLDGVLYREAWRYGSRVTHVLGEFYWVVKAGQRTRHVDYVGTGAWPQRRLNREQTGSGRDEEVTWSAGETIDAETVRRAFGLPDDRRAAMSRDVTPTTQRKAFKSQVLLWLFIVLLMVFFARCDDGAGRCDDERQAFGEDSREYRECVQRGGTAARTSGGSWGGGSSGGHK